MDNPGEEGTNLMAKSDMPPKLQQSLRTDIPTEIIQDDQVQDLLQGVPYLDIHHVRNNCCCHEAKFTNKQYGVDIKLVKKSSCCGMCSDKYHYYYNDQQIATASQGCCKCCGGSWNLELKDGKSLKSEQIIPGVVKQHKGLGVIPCDPQAFQREYTIQRRRKGNYCCCMCCTTMCECCKVRNEPCCPMSCCKEGGSCKGLCCLCIWMFCPGKSRCKCCPMKCMYGEGCCSCLCYCCVQSCCPVTLKGAHNYITSRKNIPFCCFFSEFHLEFDPNMTSIDKYTCILQTAVKK